MNIEPSWFIPPTRGVSEIVHEDLVERYSVSVRVMPPSPPYVVFFFLSYFPRLCLILVLAFSFSLPESYGLDFL